MKKEWFAAKELAGLDGLPSSPQGVNLMAKREGWEQRRRRGVQGKAVEYHIESLPHTILNSLQFKGRSCSIYDNTTGPAGSLG